MLHKVSFLGNCDRMFAFYSNKDAFKVYKGYKKINLQIVMEPFRTKEIKGIMQTAGEQLSLELIKEQLLNIIRYDPAETVDHEGKVLPLNEIPEHTRAGILSYEPSASGTKVRGYNKLTAIALALKLEGLKTQVKKKGEIADVIAEEMKKLHATSELNIPPAGEQILKDQVEGQMHDIIANDPACPAGRPVEAIDHEGNMLALNETAKSARSAIQAYKPSAAGIKVRSHSKLAAIARAIKLRGREPPGTPQDFSFPKRLF